MISLHPSSHSADPSGNVVPTLSPSSDCLIDVALKRCGPSHGQYAAAPMFAKPVEESWFVVLGDVR